MPEKIATKPIIADPSKFSLREEALNLKFTGTERRFNTIDPGYRLTEVYVDTETGEKFHRIDRDGSFQKFLSLLVKGVINVSDIVKIVNDYYTHEQNFDSIESGKENITIEMEADLFIIRCIFDDYDHNFLLGPHPLKLKKKVEHKNLIINESNSKLNFFDFHNAFYDYKRGIILNRLSLEKTFKKIFSDNNFELNPNKNKIIEILRRKLRFLSTLLGENELERFKKIIAKSGLNLEDKDRGPRVLFDDIRLRLQVLDEVLSELKLIN